MADPTDVAPPLTPDERAELVRLRAEVRGLREPRPRAGRRRWRWTLASVLIVFGCLAAPLAVTAIWVDSEVRDTERYVATVAPLAHDPAIQQALTDRITQETVDRIDLTAITGEAADALARLGLPERA